MVWSMERKRGGAAIGTRYKTNVATYDPSTGRTYRAGVTLEPDDAVRLLTMAERAGLSVSGLFNALLKNAEVDPETGLPPFLEPAPEDAHLFREAS